MFKIQGPFGAAPTQSPTSLSGESSHNNKPAMNPGFFGDDSFARPESPFNNDGSLRSGWVRIEPIPVEGPDGFFMQPKIAGFARIGEPIREGWQIVPGQDVGTAVPIAEGPISEGPSSWAELFQGRFEGLSDTLGRLFEILSQRPGHAFGRLVDTARNIRADVVTPAGLESGAGPEPTQAESVDPSSQAAEPVLRLEW
jgi:hypothetical protein